MRFGTLVLGDLAIGGIAGDLYTGDKGAFATPDISGNLGGGVFKRFTLAFDYAKRTVHFAPNALFGQADAYDRSGLFLLGEGDALRIADVTAHSAGAKAGLRVDDRILSIDGEKIAPRTLDAWRTLLRETPAGTRLKIEVVRAGAVTMRELVLADRIPARAAKKPAR
ncbi:PDZ domain-containing protein [Dokdonella sp. MW10]|uniref:PDZ domain-containing protein n=1 Tax=Dokdonella sp. MW10 TaxID=2992926 RepID=UPI003F7DC154